MTELATYEATNVLTVQMDYARAVMSASMLPDNYRGKPADILLAVGLGHSMGLSPAESLYRISVIKGKPTASAELVAANVRKAGHRLRVSIEPGKATCTIWRSDDPEFAFEVVRDAAWAQSMGLAQNDNYKKQGDTMLSWRAITACARLACPEALYGVAYTSDEMYDMSGGERARHEVTVEQTSAPAEPNRGAATDSVEPPTADVEQPAGAEPRDTEGQMKAMHASFNEAGITERQDRLDFAMSVVNREIESSNDLTWDERGAVIDALKALPRDAEVVS